MKTYLIALSLLLFPALGWCQKVPDAKIDELVNDICEASELFRNVEDRYELYSRFKYVFLRLTWRMPRDEKMTGDETKYATETFKRLEKDCANVVRILQNTHTRTKAASVDMEYLRGLVMPDFDQKYKELNQYMEGVRTATLNREDVKKWQRDIEAAKNIKEVLDEADQEQMDLAQIANEQMNRIKHYLDQTFQMESQKRFKPYFELLKIIEGYKKENSYELVFWIGTDGLMNIDYGEGDSESRIRGRIEACVSLETNVSSSMSEAEKQEALKKQSLECQSKILDPLVDSSIDITESIAEILKKS